MSIKSVVLGLLAIGVATSFASTAAAQTELSGRDRLFFFYNQYQISRRQQQIIRSQEQFRRDFNRAQTVQRDAVQVDPVEAYVRRVGEARQFERPIPPIYGGRGRAGYFQGAGRFFNPPQGTFR